MHNTDEDKSQSWLGFLICLATGLFMLGVLIGAFDHGLKALAHL